MRNKYGNSGGDLHHDNCFNFKYEYEEIDSDGKPYQTYDDINLNFGLQKGNYRNLCDGRGGIRYKNINNFTYGNTES